MGKKMDEILAARAPARAKAIERSKQCAASFIRAGRMCGGCQFDQFCGIGHVQRRGLEKLLREIDPSGLNIQVIGLGPLGQRRTS